MTKYIQGHNMPGYMPDCEPSEFNTLEDAKESLIWWAEQYIDCMADCGEDYSKEEEILNEVKTAPAQECNVYIGDYVYWITEEV